MNNLSFSFDDIKKSIYDFFHPVFEGYTNFSFTQNEQKMLPIIVFGIFLGVFLAACYTIYIRSVLGNFTRKLSADKICTPEDAKTIEELGFKNNIFIRRALKKPFSIRRVVNSVEYDRHLASRSEENFRYKPREEHFYLREENQYKAERRFGKKKTAWHTILFVLLCIAICEIVLFAALPELVGYLDRVMSNFTVAGNTDFH